jgi:hypothetical protein
MARRLLSLIIVAASAAVLAGCAATSMQGYADLERPAQPIQHIAAFVGPALLPALASEAKKQGVLLEDALSFLPPTRQYTEPEIRKAMAARGVDGVLVITMTGDTGAQQQYAGTVTTGNSTAVGTTMYGGGYANDLGVGFRNERINASHRFSRAIAFEARLSDPQTSRKFWVGGGQTNSSGGGLIGVISTSNGVNAASIASNIFTDLRAKELIDTAGT